MTSLPPRSPVAATTAASPPQSPPKPPVAANTGDSRPESPVAAEDNPDDAALVSSPKPVRHAF